MSEIITGYRPVHIEFDQAHDGGIAPETLGAFATAEEAELFMAKKFNTENTPITVNRLMDHAEKTELRKQVNLILEDKLPLLEKEERKVITEFEEVTKKKKNAIEAVSAATNEAKGISVEIKEGKVPMTLDEQFTWKMPVKGKFYFYTYIDKIIRLVKIREMTPDEKSEIWSQGQVNEEVFENGTAATQTGEKE